ncbi:hypothetical protein AGRO_5111 [Agrobacterium sp. ATCC 31749]|nr:hypothetical protein AGRO_5111 [Agrobacterium sp. ATCC 31749]
MDSHSTTTGFSELSFEAIAADVRLMRAIARRNGMSVRMKYT